ncbi:MAG: tRNA (guanosine(18)-2'-O)-methyltransferase [Saprospiraceae bacterium]|nr:tRNA (guanosine(18)-2'-O)-methyltransferase [Saprospiraceae bacterium]
MNAIEKRSMEALQRPSIEDFKNLEKFPLVLVLDNVRSGLNVGSIFRTADAFLLEKILLCGITAQPPHREILKTALGSTESVGWEYFPETTEAVRSLKKEGYLVFAVEQTTGNIWLQDFSPEAGKKYALVLGNEVDGVGDQALALCDGAIEIPQFGTKHSLNVAVAAGIAVWETVRKINDLAR